MTEAEVDARPDADFILGGFGYFTVPPGTVGVYYSATAFGWNNTDLFIQNVSGMGNITSVSVRGTTT